MPNVILGITSSIAIYKSVELLRLFLKRNWQTKVVLTPSAVNLISSQIFTSLGASGAYWDLFLPKSEGRIEDHISLSKWGECLVIAPCSANTLAKVSLGIADNLLTSLALAFDPSRIVIAPAMHSQMYLARPTQEHLARLREMGIFLVGPEEGDLASGDKGIGRLVSLERIVEAVERMLEER